MWIYNKVCSNVESVLHIVNYLKFVDHVTHTHTHYFSCCCDKVHDLRKGFFWITVKGTVHHGGRSVMGLVTSQPGSREMNCGVRPPFPSSSVRDSSTNSDAAHIQGGFFLFSSTSSETPSATHPGAISYEILNLLKLSNENQPYALGFCHLVLLLLRRACTCVTHLQ